MKMKLPKFTKGKRKLTIEENLKEVASEICSNNGKIKKSEPSLKFLMEVLGITEMSAKVLSCIACGYSVFKTFTAPGYQEIIKWMGLEEEHPDVVKKRIIELLEKNYIFTEYSSSWYERLILSEWFKNSLQEQELSEEKLDNLETLDLIIAYSDYLDPLVAKYSYDRTRYMTAELCYNLISDLFKKNQSLEFVRQFNKVTKNLINPDTSKQYKLVILYLIRQLVVNGEDKSNFDDFEGIFGKTSLSRQKVSFQYNRNDLFSLGLLEEDGQNWRGSGYFKLSDSIKEDLLKDVELKKAKISLLTYPEKIVEKELFYESEFYRRMEDLESFIGKEKFEEIKERLEKKGFKSGLSCLFYGNPGTGKTESVYQLAKKTGRPIYSVDLSEIRDKYVGESEKRLKEIFTRYKKLAKERKQDFPILLFNEADGIIGTRIEGQGDSVDKMENAMQNILLQELEDFEGILIATTNLQGNLDKAFDRRFLYKLKFPVPTPEIKAKIWMSKIEELGGEDALKLSKEFDLSGGQIDNIARKYVINQILHGHGSEDIYETLRKYCKEEKIETHGKIGFLSLQ